jgi:hypothetical protein
VQQQFAVLIRPAQVLAQCPGAGHARLRRRHRGLRQCLPKLRPEPPVVTNAGPIRFSIKTNPECKGCRSHLVGAGASRAGLRGLFGSVRNREEEKSSAARKDEIMIVVLAHGPGCNGVTARDAITGGLS